MSLKRCQVMFKIKVLDKIVKITVHFVLFVQGEPHLGEKSSYLSCQLPHFFDPYQNQSSHSEGWHHLVGSFSKL